MAKGLRSKVKKRWRSVKREHLENIKGKADLQQISERLHATLMNRPYRQPEPKNAFLYPNDPDAVFPQYKPPPLIDFRSSAIPNSGLVYSGSKRPKNVVKTILVNDDLDENDKTNQIVEEQVEDQELNQEEDDLANALGGFGLQSKREKRKLRKQQGINEEFVVNKAISKKQKAPRQLRKTKKIIKF